MSIDEIKQLLEKKIAYLSACITSAQNIGDIERVENLTEQLDITVDALAKINTL